MGDQGRSKEPGFWCGGTEVTPQLMELLTDYCEACNVTPADLMAENIRLKAELAELKETAENDSIAADHLSWMIEDFHSCLDKLSGELRERGGHISAQHLVDALKRVKEIQHNWWIGVLDASRDCSCPFCSSFFKPHNRQPGRRPRGRREHTNIASGKEVITTGRQG